MLKSAASQWRDREAVRRSFHHKRKPDFSAL